MKKEKTSKASIGWYEGLFLSILSVIFWFNLPNMISPTILVVAVVLLVLIAITCGYLAACKQWFLVLSFAVPLVTANAIVSKFYHFTDGVLSIAVEAVVLSACEVFAMYLTINALPKKNEVA